MLDRLEHLLNAVGPIPVTLTPPKVSGIASIPLNPVGAVNPVIVALPFVMVYVSPEVVFVSARTVSLLMAVIPMTIKRLRTMERIRFARVLFITFPPIFMAINTHVDRWL